MSLTFSADELEELALNLGRIAEWLRESCSARHADDMAEVVSKAEQVIDDLWIGADDDSA